MAQIPKIIPAAEVFVQVDPSVSGLGAGYVSINGAGSAGAKHVIAAAGASDGLAEMTRFDFPSGTSKVTIQAVNGVAAHVFSVRATFMATPSDALAAVRLQNGASGVRHIPADGEREFSTRALSGASFSVYLVAVPATGATLASVKGDILVEGN